MITFFALVWAKCLTGGVLHFQIQEVVFGLLEGYPSESVNRTVETVANGACFLCSCDGVHSDICAAFVILEQNKCFWESWRAK